MLARAFCLAWAVLAAGQEDVEEVGFSFDGGQVLPPSPPAPGAINLDSSPASTWGAWRMVRLNDDLFVQSLDGNKRFHFVADSNGWFYYSFEREPFRTLFGSHTEEVASGDLPGDWLIGADGAAPLADESVPTLSHSGTRLSMNGTMLQILQVSDELEHLLKSVLLDRMGEVWLLRNPGWQLLPWASHADVANLADGAPLPTIIDVLAREKEEGGTAEEAEEGEVEEEGRQQAQQEEVQEGAAQEEEEAPPPTPLPTPSRPPPPPTPRMRVQRQPPTRPQQPESKRRMEAAQAAARAAEKRAKEQAEAEGSD